MPIPPLSRRSFLTGTAVAAVGAVTGYAVARNTDAAKRLPVGAAANAYGPAPKPKQRRAIAPLRRLQGDGIVTHGIVLTRDAAGTVHGVSATCTHQGCTVGAPHRGVVTCPCHGSQFDATTGRVLRGPASQPLPSVAVTVQGDQVVEG